MSSALKPALPSTGGQSSPAGNPPTAGKPQNMPQHTGASNPYSATPLGHVAQNLAGLPHAHSNMNAAQNLTANMAINQVPNIPQMGHSGMNQSAAQAAHNMPMMKASSLPAATAASAMPAHARPNTHAFMGATGAPPAAHHEEGTTLPPSQNSAQLMAMHRAQQMQHHIDQQPSDRFKHQAQTNQQQSQPSSQNQQSPQQQHQQSNGMTEQVASKNTTTTNVNANATVPTTPTKPTESPAPVQNHVTTPPATSAPTLNDTNAKVVEDTPAATPASGNASQPQAQPATIAATTAVTVATAATVTTTLTSTTTTTTTTNTESQNTKQTPSVTVSVTESPSNTENANESPVSAPTPSPTLSPSPIPTPSTPTKSSTAPIVASIVAPAVVKESSSSKPPSTMKLATTPRNITRKRESKSAKTSDNPKGAISSPSKTPDGKSPGAQNNRPPDKVKAPRTPSEEEGRSKRTRTRTQPYQSPIPELALITKLSSSTASPAKNQDEKLIVFYKNEFLAVRNSEGGFYVCQAVQNVYKSSMRIRIRWLSEGHDKIYVPDFYDTTEFDCILTNINMDRVDKGKYNLPKDELERTENILKRAIAVESGESAPSLTEEHPDGLDLSLFRDESQLKKKQKKSLKRKSASSAGGGGGGGSPSKKSKKSKRNPDRSKSRKASKSPAKSPMKRSNQLTERERKIVSNSNSSNVASQSNRRSDGGRAERANRRGANDSVASTSSPLMTLVKTSPVIDQKKTRVLAKVAIKSTQSIASTSSAYNKKKGLKASTSGNNSIKSVLATTTTTIIATPSTSTSKSGIKSTRSQGSVPVAQATAASVAIATATASTSSHSTRRKKGKK